MQFTVVVKPWHQEYESIGGTVSSQEQGVVIAGAELDFPMSFLFFQGPSSWVSAALVRASLSSSDTL